MGISIGTRGSSMSEPNIVPLIDVLLVLIIIFMAITPTTPTGMDTLIPQPPKVTKLRTPPNAAVVVVVTADGNVMIDQTPTTWSDLGSQLADIFKIRADKTAFVKGGDDAEFTYVARAIDIMRGSGITNVGLITATMEARR